MYTIPIIPRAAVAMNAPINTRVTCDFVVGRWWLGGGGACVWPGGWVVCGCVGVRVCVCVCMRVWVYVGDRASARTCMDVCAGGCVACVIVRAAGVLEQTS